MSQERATQEDNTREIARIHKLIERIQAQAETLQKATLALPDGPADMLNEKAEELLQAADALLEEVEDLEQQNA